MDDCGQHCSEPSCIRKPHGDDIHVRGTRGCQAGAKVVVFAEWHYAYPPCITTATYDTLQEVEEVKPC